MAASVKANDIAEAEAEEKVDDDGDDGDDDFDPSEREDDENGLDDDREQAVVSCDDNNNNDGDLISRDPAAARIDRQLQVNFDIHASKFFPPWQHRPNAFRDVMESLALKHQGVRCGLICLSAQHLLQLEPNNRSLQERYRVHLGIAVRYSINLYRLCGHSCTTPNPDSSDAYVA